MNVKALLRRHRPDREWILEVAELRPVARRRGAVLTSLLLDTSVLIEVERDGFDLDALIEDDDEPAIAAITVVELGVGVEIASGKRNAAPKRFLDEVVATLPIIGYDTREL